MDELRLQRSWAGAQSAGSWYHPVRQVELYGKVAHAMGDYIFTDATSGDKVRGSG